MCFTGGGIGHRNTYKATRCFYASITEVYMANLNEEEQADDEEDHEDEEEHVADDLEDDELALVDQEDDVLSEEGWINGSDDKEIRGENYDEESALSFGTM